MWGGAPRAALARALLAGKLFHFDINDGYRLKHDVDIGVGLVNPLDWLNVLVLLRSHGYNGPVQSGLQTTAHHQQFRRIRGQLSHRGGSLHHAVGNGGRSDLGPHHQGGHRRIEGGRGPGRPLDVEAITAANRELLTLHELIAHRLVQILLGLHRGRTYAI